MSLAHRKQVQAIDQPQAHEQGFFQAFLRTERPQIEPDVGPRGDAIDILDGRIQGAPPVAAIGGVRAAAKADPLPFLPVFQIVSGPARRRPSDVRDFILLVAGPIEAAEPFQYISAASSSGATDQPARAISSFNGAFG